MHPFLNLKRAISQPGRPRMSFLLTSPSDISHGQTRSTVDLSCSDSNTKTTTLDFLVPRPRVRVCQACCARMEKFVGMKAAAVGKGLDPGSAQSKRLNSRAEARFTLKFLIISCPPKRSPFTAEVG
eukprot:Gb_27098 [translate_table: standard]